MYDDGINGLKIVREKGQINDVINEKLRKIVKVIQVIMNKCKNGLIFSLFFCCFVGEQDNLGGKE